MSNPRLTKIGFICFAIFSSIFGTYTYIQNDRVEIFPFFSWDLFWVVPSYKQEYVVHLLEANGETFESPLLFNEAGKYLPQANSINAVTLIQTLGNAIESDDENAEQYRLQFEALYLSHLTSVTYELAFRKYDPLKLYQEGKIDELNVISTFGLPASNQ